MDLLAASLLCLATFIIGNLVGRLDMTGVYSKQFDDMVIYKNHYINLYYKSLLVTCYELLTEGNKDQYKVLADAYTKAVKDIMEKEKEDGLQTGKGLEKQGQREITTKGG